MGDCPVANIPLRDWMTTELNRAGFDIVSIDKSNHNTVFLPIDDWVDIGVLCMLARASRPTSLHCKDREIIAWKGCRDPDQCIAKMITQVDPFRIRYPWDLLRLNESIISKIDEPEINGSVSPLSEVHGKLILGSGSRILPGVFIEGNVVIGKNCRIGPNCYLRGSTAIGDHCIIGNGVEVKNSVIFPHTRITHNSFVGDSIIGSHVNLGASTVISNARHDGRTHYCQIEHELIDTKRFKLGAIIGDGVRTGVNTTILPGRIIGKGRTTAPAAKVDRNLL